MKPSILGRVTTFAAVALAEEGMLLAAQVVEDLVVREAAAAAQATGFPVAVKLASATITHKSDIGGVILGARSAAAVRQAFRTIRQRLRALGRLDEMQGVQVQEMAPEGVEAIIGVTQDPSFGPLMMFGLGGIFVEVLKDVAFRIVPLEPRDARQMVREIKGFPVLEGVRGQPPADLAALEGLILKLSEFVEAHPEIEELDLNPVFAYADGVIAVDARIVIS